MAQYDLILTNSVHEDPFKQGHIVKFRGDMNFGRMLFNSVQLVTKGHKQDVLQLQQQGGWVFNDSYCGKAHRAG